VLSKYKSPKLTDIYMFVTSSENWTPFGIHQDFEDSIIIDISGSGRDIYFWENGSPFKSKVVDSKSFMGIDLSYTKHLSSAKKVTLKNGDIFNIPKGKKHDVHGKGEISMHFTIAFEGFNGFTYDELSHEEKLKVLSPRVGNAFPFSMNADLCLPETSFRGYYNFLPPFYIKEGYVHLSTQKRTVKFKSYYLNILQQLQLKSNTSEEISNHLNIDQKKVLEFIKFSLSNGLIITGVKH